MISVDSPVCSAQFVERLPHRLLYAGEFISIQLVGLQSNRALIRYRPPDRILLLVAFGRIQLHTARYFSVMKEGDEVQLDPPSLREPR